MSYTTRMHKKKGPGRKKFTFQEALEKIYIIRFGTSSGYVSFPGVLAGKRIRIRIVGEEEADIMKKQQEQIKKILDKKNKQNLQNQILAEKQRIYKEHLAKLGISIIRGF